MRGGRKGGWAGWESNGLVANASTVPVANTGETTSETIGRRKPKQKAQPAIEAQSSIAFFAGWLLLGQHAMSSMADISVISATSMGFRCMPTWPAAGST